MSKRSKRKAARLRLKRLAVFACLVASTPLWLGPWRGAPTPANQRENFAHRLRSGRADQADAGSQRPGRLFLAALDAGSAPADDSGQADVRPTDGIVTEMPFDAQPAQPARPAITPLDARPAPRVAPSRPRQAPPAPKKRSVTRRSHTRTMRMLVTAYCPCAKCCGQQSDGITACGKTIYTNRSRFVAADKRLLGFGTRVSIPGYYGGSPVPVYDRGGKIKGHRLDVFFLSHWRAKQWGSRWLTVTVYDR